ncbi:MAG TPA: BBE domain-containing protein, partial [Rhodothermales bacterium]|nr:BBE domain-containing protein [Rhodothermales bacterium]
FGVATRFQFRLHAVDEVVGGMMILPATPEVVASGVAEAMNAPDELSGMFNVTIAPPLPFIPAEAHGRPIIMALLVYAGDADAAERVLAPFRALATPIVDQIRPMRYPELYEGPEPPHPSAVAVRSFFIDTLDRTAAETVIDRLQASTAPMRVTQFRVLGGAVARVAPEATAFVHRRRRMLVVVGAAYEHAEEAAEHEAWVAGLASALRQGAPGAYVGFLGDKGETGAHEAYPSPTWERLQAIKARYDPANLFRLNQNIPPADG